MSHHGKTPGELPETIRQGFNCLCWFGIFSCVVTLAMVGLHGDFLFGAPVAVFGGYLSTVLRWSVRRCL